MKKRYLFSLCLLLFLSTSLPHFAQEKGIDPAGRAPYHYVNSLKKSDDISSTNLQSVQHYPGTTKSSSVKVSGDDWAFAYNCYDPTGIIPEGTVLFTDSGLVSTGGTATNFLCAGTFDAANQTWYAYDYPGYDFYMVDYMTGDIEFIGSNGSIGINGLAYDLSSDQLFGVDADNLYSVDKSTGGCNFIGPSGLNLNYIALACSPSGLLYAFDMNNNALYQINKLSGAAALVGTFPFDVIYAQGADFDLDNNILYWTAWDNQFGMGVLYIVNPTNASLTYLEVLGPELDALGIYSTPIPVELSSFTADVDDHNVNLTWTTATETNNSGFEILRKESGVRSQESEWKTIGFVPGHGTTTEFQQYSFTDDKLETGKYQYRLKQIDFDGSFEYSQIVDIEIPIAYEFSLSQNYPNPFNPGTVISYQLAVSSNVTLKVFDILGNEVATLVDEYKQAGKYEVEFNTSSIKHQPSSGVYFYQLQADSFVETKKMMLMK